MRRGSRDQLTGCGGTRLIPKPATPKLKASVQDARLLLGRGLHRTFFAILERVLAQELQLLVLTFASLRGQCLKENAVFCGVAESCIDVMDEPLAIERTQIFVRSFVVSLRNRNITKTFRCRLVLNSAPTASSSKRVVPGRRTSASQQA